ncbi:MAG: hypothetical protein KDB16_07085, partial [Acidimicrobiales bacterium]|nr:hypothetical protein [Acidimicrobiales bacterium]
LYRVLPDPSGRYYGPGDSDQNIWFGWRFGQAFREWNLIPLRFEDMLVPFGFDVVLVDGYLPLWVSGWFNLIAPPVLAYNLTLSVIAMVNYFAFLAVARQATSSRFVAMVAALTTATAPVLMTRFTGHIQLACAFTIALLFREALLTASGGLDGSTVARRSARLAALVVIAFLCSVYFFFAGLAVYLLTLTLLGQLRKRYLLSVALAGLVVTAVLAPLALARVGLERSERAARTIEEQASREVFYDVTTRVYSADILSVAIPSDPTLLSLGEAEFADLPRTGETLTFPGYVALFALVAGAIVHHRFRVLVAVLALGTVAVSLGPILRFDGYEQAVFGDNVGYMPYELVRRMPVLDAMRAPSRFALALPPIAALAIASLGDRALAQFSWTRTRVGMCVIGLLAAGLSSVSILDLVATDGLSIPHALEGIDERAKPEDAILVVPTDCRGIEVMYLHLQVSSRLPMVGCGPQFQSLPWASELRPYLEHPSMTALRCRPNDVAFYYGADRVAKHSAEIPDELQTAFGVRFLVVDLWALASDDCNGIEDHVSDLAETHETWAANERFAVIDLHHQVPG